MKSKVLIVEDESIVAKDLEMIIKNAGYKVCGTASTGKNAVELAKKKEPNVVLMDIMLKGEMSGIEAAEIIKKDQDVPVIYITANTDASTLEKAKITQPHGFVTKPFQDIQVKTAIEMSLYKFDKEIDLLKERDMLYTIVDNNNENSDSFYVKSKSKYIKVKGDDIIMVEALKDYVVIHTKDGKYTIHSTMKNMEDKLPRDRFARAHRSYIVRLSNIKYMEYSNLCMEGVDKLIPVGGNYKEMIQEKLNFF